MKKTKISKDMLQHIISHIANIYISLHGNPSDNYKDYDEHIDGTSVLIDEDNEQLYAKLGLEFFLTFPNIDIEYYEGTYPYNDGELKSIITYAYKKLWPNSKLPETPPPIELIDMDMYEWRKIKEKLNPHMHTLDKKLNF